MLEGKTRKTIESMRIIHVGGNNVRASAYKEGDTNLD